MFEITKEILLKAEDYLPLGEKARIAGEIAMQCVTSISYQIDVGGVPVDAPDYHGRNTALRERFLLGYLLGVYLKISFDSADGSPYLLSLDDYDRAARLHPLNALERFKSDPETREKVFDLLRDYKLFGEMVRTAIEDVVSAQNDPAQRYLSAQAAAVTPEALQALADAEGQLREQIEMLKQTGAEAQGILRGRKTGTRADGPSDIIGPYGDDSFLKREADPAWDGDAPGLHVQPD